MEQTFTRSKKERKPRSWLVILDYVYYAAIVGALGGLAYYLYQYRGTIALFLPTLLAGAGLTIFLSVSSIILATIFGFIGALGRLSRFAPLRTISALYVEVIRAIPILLQLFAWAFAIRLALVQLGFYPYSVPFKFMIFLQRKSLF